MRLVLDSDPTLFSITGYGGGEIVIGEQRIRQPCIVSARELVLDWPATAPSQLNEALLESMLRFAPRIILLGSDDRQLPPAATRRDLNARGIALECMGLGAACRTYNVLVQELRPVVAGLFPA